MKHKASFLMAAASLGLLVLLGSLSLALFYAPAAGAQSETAGSDLPRTITVVGEGKVSVAPDMAQVNIGVETIGPEVKQASNEAAGVMEGLLSALTGQGVAQTDIQTSYYNIWLERPYTPDGTPGGQTIYHVNNNVAVTVRNLDNLTTVLSAAIDAGANTVNSIDFKVAEPDRLRSEARQKAVDDALATAQELAGLNGVEVGQVVSISEVIGSGTIFVSEVSMAQGMGGGGAGPISPGQVEVSAQLQVTYALK